MKPFKLVPVVEDYMDIITSIAFKSGEEHGHLYAGTASGFVVLFNVATSDSPEKIVNSGVQVEQLRLTTKKPITKLAVLSHTYIACHYEFTLQLVPVDLRLDRAAVTVSRACSVFSSRRGGNSLCIAHKKKLYLYANGTEITKEIPLKEPAFALCWHRRWICIGFKKEYVVFDENTSSIHHVFSLSPTSPLVVTSTPGICVVSDEDEVILLGQEGLGIFFNLATLQPSLKNTIQWPWNKVQSSICIGVCGPYIVGAVPSGQVEVYSLRDQRLCQTFNVEEVRSLSDNDGRLFLGGDYQAVCLAPVPYSTQIKKLLLEVRVAEALDLLNSVFGPEDPLRGTELSEFHRLAGWTLFRDLQFSGAFQHFSYAEMNILHILAFWQDYLPPDWIDKDVRTVTSKEADIVPEAQDISAFIARRLAVKQTQQRDAEQPEEHSTATDVLLESASVALVTFLLKERSAVVLGTTHRFQWAPESAIKKRKRTPANEHENGHGESETKESSVDENFECANVQGILEVVDLLLLKLMIAVEDRRWRDLIENPQWPIAVAAELVEGVIKEKKRYDIWAVLLKRFGRYKEALEVLSNIVGGRTTIPPPSRVSFVRAADPFSALRELCSTLLSKDDVLRYLPLILSKDPQAALDVLKNGPVLSAAEALRILDSCQFQEKQSITEAYLEHVVANQSAHFKSDHKTKLACLYIDRVCALKADSDSSAKAGQESGILGEERAKLLQYLEHCDGYDVLAVLAKAKENRQLIEERVILFGRANQHRQALELLVRELKDVPTAEAYCHSVNCSDRRRSIANDWRTSASLFSEKSMWRDSSWKSEAASEGETSDSEQEDNHHEIIQHPPPQMLFLLFKVLLQTWETADEESELKMICMTACLNMLEKYPLHGDLDPINVVPLLPETWPLCDVLDYCVDAMREKLHKSMMASIQENLCSMSYLAHFETCSEERTKSVIITPERACPVCTRRLDDKPFTAYPNGTCVHLACAPDLSQDPDSGRRFSSEADGFI